ncbi:SH3 domain-containing protein [Chryseolinea lacunae]|uniref:SH3b domain-containing protein n=1 Tax=Chryseolinea lacunae TaxID=2801331 RepID=A0ABS1KTN0_9BACT|nr:SH3 domain-containing protein [Chryseolinea lacunae]MBL0742622.1 hypothetical protein [Chryseolinea lacunae]
MQRRVLKNLIILALSFFSGLQAASAQVGAFRLAQADSLYGKKRYVQSLEHYQAILNQHEYSPAMLLKMAYIQEGLNRVGPALYYLNLYNLATDDEQVLDKMEELATKHNLEGYSQTDKDLALSFYHNYHQPLSAGLAVVALFLVGLTVFSKRRGGRGLAPGLACALVLVGLVVHINFGEKTDTGIIGNGNAFLMDGPSPGASVISVVDEGHRVQIVGHRDVWIEILWNGQTAYIRDTNLLPVRL